MALAARVPSGDATEDLFNPLLRGRAVGSQGDVWWLSWDGNPGLNAGRSHPLGVMVEQRGLGWNFPVGNEDIVYFVYTFYNVTASDPAAYADASGPACATSPPARARCSSSGTRPRSASPFRTAATPSPTSSPPSRPTWTWPRPA